MRNLCEISKCCHGYRDIFDIRTDERTTTGRTDGTKADERAGKRARASKEILMVALLSSTMCFCDKRHQREAATTNGLEAGEKDREHVTVDSIDCMKA